MKKIKLIVASLFSLALVLSCNDDGGDSNLNLTTGAVPDLEKTEGSESFINLSSIQEGEEIAISLNVSIAQGLSGVSSVDVVGYYIKADGTAEKGVLAAGLTSFPVAVTITKDVLFQNFTSLNSADDFAIGDQLKISTDITLKNGQVINLLNANGSQNYGPDIANSPLYTVTQTYLVSCPSDLGGTYASVSSGSSTDSGPTPDENPIANYTSTVTLTDNGGGNYIISDPYGGLYNLWYDIYGITPDFNLSETVIDVCGTISGSWTDAFGGAVTFEGIVNEDGTITFTWINEFGDTGTTTLTKQ